MVGIVRERVEGEVPAGIEEHEVGKVEKEVVLLALPQISQPSWLPGPC